jgi:DNA-binding transcriptional MerR regulator
VLKIGDFSKLVQVSVRMLHHYDRLGLLKPIRVDADTGYRYYGVHQMARLNRILALKDLGLSLAQIAAVLDQPLSAEQLRGMLRLQQADLRQRVEREQARLARVEARLRLIAQEGTMTHDGVVLKPVAAQTVAAAREAIDDPRGIPARCRALHNRLRDALQHASVKPSGAWFVIFHDKGLRDESIEVEVAFPIEPAAAARLSTNDRLVTYELSAVETVAAFIHQGSLATIEETYAAAWRWVEANGYRMVGPWPYREVYLSDEDSVGGAVIEVQMPVQIDLPNCRAISQQLFSGLFDLHDEPRCVLHAAGAHPHVDLPPAQHREEFALRLVAARRNWLRDDLRRGHAHLLHHRREHHLVGGDRLAATVANLDCGGPLAETQAVERELELVALRLAGLRDPAATTRDQDDRKNGDNRQPMGNVTPGLSRGVWSGAKIV